MTGTLVNTVLGGMTGLIREFGRVWLGAMAKNCKDSEQSSFISTKSLFHGNCTCARNDDISI
jgi:hypothetical protein